MAKKAQSNKLSFLLSAGLHLVLLAVFVLSLEHVTPALVIENSDTDQQIIAASLLPPPISKPEKIETKPIILQEKAKIEDAIVLKKVEKKVLPVVKAEAPKKPAKPVFQHTKITDEFEKEIKERSAKALQNQLIQAEKSVKETKMRGIVDKYKALILQSISVRWLVPSGIDKQLSTVLKIKLAPGGTVMDVVVLTRSGNDLLDRSARDAVLKASPLPVPSDRSEFEQFRQFELKVKPLMLTAS